MLLWLVLAAASATGESPDHAERLTERCLLRELEQAEDQTTVGAVRKACAGQTERERESLLLSRLQRERLTEGVPSLLTPHKRNYLIPASYVASPNEEPFENELGVVPPGNRLDHVEAKFQLSIKLALADSVLTRRDRVHFGFTALSFWQAYNHGVSAPFRETDYEPELFWTTPLEWGPLGLDAGLFTLGVNHQSNGRGGSQSRSWNRVYAKLQFEKDDLVVGLTPWWRIPEDEKDDPLDATGDDNPDIEKYMGHFELTTAYRRGAHTWSIMVRRNTGSDKGAVQLDWSFPLWRDLRGYAQYFNGYGESLIDYNARIERVGVGILLTDPF